MIITRNIAKLIADMFGECIQSIARHSDTNPLHRQSTDRISLNNNFAFFIVFIVFDHQV